MPLNKHPEEPSSDTVPNLGRTVREPEAPANLIGAVNALPSHHRIGVQLELHNGVPLAQAVRNVMGSALLDGSQQE